jgi:hypothetical protein
MIRENAGHRAIVAADDCDVTGYLIIVLNAQYSRAYAPLGNIRPQSRLVIDYQ